MKHTLYLILCTALTVAAQQASAQSVDEGRRLTRNEQYEDAEKLFNQIITASPKKGDGYYWAGINYLEQGDSAAANEMFNRGLTNSPKFTLGHVGKGYMALRQGKLSEAQALFVLALKAKKKMRPMVQREIARAYLTVPYLSKARAKEYAKYAKGHLDLAGEEDYEVFLLRGDAAFILNQVELNEAIENYIQSTYKNTGSPLPLLREALVYQRVRNFDLSLVRVDEALSKDVNFAPGYRQKAELFAEMRKADSAVFYYKEYLKRNNNFSARKKYVNALYFNGEYNEAIKQAKELLAIKETPNLYGVIAYAIAAKNDTSKVLNKEGLEYFDKYEEKFVKPANRGLSPSENYFKGALLFRSGDRDGGWALQRLALLDTASAASKWYDQARELNYAAKKYDRVLEILQLKYSKTGTRSSLDQYYLAMSYRMLERYEESNKVFEEIVTSDTTYLKGYQYIALNWQNIDPKDSTGNVEKAYLRWISRMTPENKVTFKREIAYAYRVIASAWDNKASAMFEDKEEKANGYVKTMEMYKKAIEFYGECVVYDPEAEDVIERKTALEKYVATQEARNKKKRK